jgi:hypothetical protein
MHPSKGLASFPGKWTAVQKVLEIFTVPRQEFLTLLKIYKNRIIKGIVSVKNINGHFLASAAAKSIPDMSIRVSSIALL